MARKRKDKPPQGMNVTLENVSYGYEGDPYDGCLGSDESLQWVAEGSLAPGESFTYVFREHCCRATRWIAAEAFTLKGKQVDLLVTIEAETPTRTWQDSGIRKACLSLTSMEGPMIWQASVTNNGRRSAKAVYFRGYNQTNFGQDCARW